MSSNIDLLRVKSTQKPADSSVPLVDSKRVTFQIEQLASETETKVNHVDKMFTPAASIPTKKAYGSLLRRTQLNVFGNVSNRMSVVMSASALDTEIETESEREPEPEVIKTKVINRGGKGLLANKLIGMMTEENIREEREVKELPSLGPLGDKNIWNFKTFPKI